MHGSVKDHEVGEPHLKAASGKSVSARAELKGPVGYSNKSGGSVNYGSLLNNISRGRR